MLRDYGWSLFLLVLPIAILAIYFTKKNNNFFDIRNIFRQHISIFNGNMVQLFVFFAIPLMLATGVTRIRLVDEKIISNLNIILSIFISMFFAMLSILCSISINNDKISEKKKLLFNETINSILFECVISVSLLIISFAIFILDSYDFSRLLCAISLLVYYLLFVIILNIFIIIKRLSKLLSMS